MNFGGLQLPMQPLPSPALFGGLASLLPPPKVEAGKPLTSESLTTRAQTSRHANRTLMVAKAGALDRGSAWEGEVRGRRSQGKKRRSAKADGVDYCSSGLETLGSLRDEPAVTWLPRPGRLPSLEVQGVVAQPGPAAAGGHMGTGRGDSARRRSRAGAAGKGK